MRVGKGMRLAAALAAGAVVAGCASSGPKTPDENPAIVAAVQATPRVVQGETTWVTRGPGYDIVAFDRRDIAAVDSAVAYQSQIYSRVFGAPPPRVVVSVYRRRFDAQTESFAPGPPLPAGDVETVVEVPLLDPRARSDDSQGRRAGGYARGAAGGGFEGMGNPTQRVMRAWLSAHATQLLGQSATQGATGLIDDPRVPAWAEAMLPALTADDSTIGRLAIALSAPNVGVYPVSDFLAMERPQPTYAAEGNGASGSGDQPGAARGGEGGEGGEGGGYGGGRGGFGGMGGGGFGGGRGGFGGGGYGGGYGGGRRGGGGGGGRSSTSARRAMPLRGAALYDAEATVFGHYLFVRHGGPVIGQMVDAALTKKSVADVLAAEKAGPKTLDELDADWRQWLAAKADNTSGH